MARIKLLTIHWGQSYGAVMQTYATCKLLEKHGHNVTVINIINPRLKWLYTKLRAFLCIIIAYQFLKFKKRYFSNFTNRCYNLKSTNLNDVDYAVVGSDQVWNRDITTPIDLSFFLKDSSAKKVSLSSSFGKNVWAESSEYTLQVKELLNSFDALSVREHSGKEILENTFDLKSTVLVDPTLAYGYYDDLVLNNELKEHIYIFFVNKHSSYKDIVGSISAQTGLDVFKHTKFSYYFKNGPRHWLTYIKNSSCVITDSFHGVAFCVLFKKNFFVLCGETKKFDRVLNLLSLLGLEDRFISSIDDYEVRKKKIHDIDYVSVYQKLSVEQKKFRDFIDTYIK